MLSRLLSTSHCCCESPYDRGHGIRLEYLSGMFWLIFLHSITSQTAHVVIAWDSAIGNNLSLVTNNHFVM